MKPPFGLIGLVIAAGLLAGCGALSPAPSATSTPTPPPTLTPRAACGQPGTTVLDRVRIPDENRSLTLSVYRPPCYAAAGSTAYPVLYWTAVGGQTMFDAADQLIRQGALSPFILVSLENCVPYRS